MSSTYRRKAHNRTVNGRTVPVNRSKPIARRGRKAKRATLASHAAEQRESLVAALAEMEPEPAELIPDVSADDGSAGPMETTKGERQSPAGAYEAPADDASLTTCIDNALVAVKKRLVAVEEERGALEREDHRLAAARAKAATDDDQHAVDLARSEIAHELVELDHEVADLHELLEALPALDSQLQNLASLEAERDRLDALCPNSAEDREALAAARDDVAFELHSLQLDVRDVKTALLRAGLHTYAAGLFGDTP